MTENAVSYKRDIDLCAQTGRRVGCRLRSGQGIVLLAAVYIVDPVSGRWLPVIGLRF
jgi:hypothetical protein